MRVSSCWTDFELIDTSDGERLERWGDVVLIRPDPQIIWDTPREHPLWRSAHAVYHRSHSGGGHWQALKKVPAVWDIGYKGLRFNLKTMGFKHTGIFPEQATNWDFISDQIRAQNQPFKILNLFGYTGAATLAAAAAGANVCHVDASKGMVSWARENACASGLSSKPVRWIVDDCVKFVQKEIRRGNRYDGIVMDPPSYGRGPGGEVWKLEDQIFFLLNLCCKILSEEAQFFVLNSYTTGLSPPVMQCMLSLTFKKTFGGAVFADEIGLPVTAQDIVLPCGSTAIWRRA